MIRCLCCSVKPKALMFLWKRTLFSSKTHPVHSLVCMSMVTIQAILKKKNQANYVVFIIYLCHYNDYYFSKKQDDRVFFFFCGSFHTKQHSTGFSGSQVMLLANYSLWTIAIRQSYPSGISRIYKMPESPKGLTCPHHPQVIFKGYQVNTNGRWKTWKKQVTKGIFWNV